MLQVSAAMVRRRRDAATLLHGTCRPAEMRWFLEFLRACQPETVDTSEAVAGALLRGVMPFVGYHAFLKVCASSARILALAVLNDATFESVGKAQHIHQALSFWCDLFDDTVALMVQPRVMPNNPLGAEHILCNGVNGLSAGLSFDLPHMARYHTWRNRLLEGLHRLNQSGVLVERCLIGEAKEQTNAAVRESVAHSERDCDAVAASGKLRSCALASCGAIEAHKSQYSRCSACKAVVYCSKTCQTADWPSHKKACKAARTAAAATQDAPDA